MKLVINDLKKLLDKNALLMSLMALICSFMALYFNDVGSQGFIAVSYTHLTLPTTF